MIKYLLSAVTILVASLYGYPVMATDMAILRTDQNTLTTIDVDGNKLDGPNGLSNSYQNLLLQTKGFNSFSDERKWGGEFLSNNEGLELVKTTGHRVKIYDQEGNKVDGFSVGDVSADRVVTVGDALTDVDGQEILVCRLSSEKAKVQIYSYDENTGEATEELSFQPFPDLITQGEKNGCNSIAVAELDGESKIVVTPWDHSPSEQAQLYVYDTDGNLESTVELGFDWDRYDPMIIDAMDFDGDESDNEIAVYHDNSLIIVDLEIASIVKNINLEYTYFSYAIGNIDSDVKDEIVVVNGKKTKLNIWNGTEKTEVGAIYPTSPQYRYRMIVIGDLNIVGE